MAVVRRQGAKARNVSQKIWLSPAEAEQLKASAGDVPVATWLRNLALGQPMPPTRPKPASRLPKHVGLIRPLAVAVARVGSNLNQIARAVNLAGRSQRPVDALLVANQLAHIRLELRAAIEEATHAGQDL